MPENPPIKPPRAHIEDLDAPDREERVRDPMEVAALVVVVVAAVALAANASLGRPSSAPAAATPSSRADAAIGPLTRSTSAPLADPLLSVRSVPGAGCGPTEGTGAYPDAGLRVTRTITRLVALDTDPLWSWCVASVLAYDQGIEVLGRLSLAPDDLGNGPAPGRPHALLRDAAFALSFQGFGELGPAKMLPASGGRVVLRVPIPVTLAARDEFMRAFAASPTVTLRLVSIDDGAGSYSFRGPEPDPRLTSDHTAVAGQYGLGAAPRAPQPLATLPLSR